MKFAHILIVVICVPIIAAMAWAGRNNRTERSERNEQFLCTTVTIEACR